MLNFNLDNNEKNTKTNLVETKKILGVTGGGHAVHITKDFFTNFLGIVVKIAELQASFISIEETLKVTNRRVNALEHIVVPRLERTIQYIKTEMDEREKEQKFAIKKVLEKKKIKKEREELEYELKMKHQAEAHKSEQSKAKKEEKDAGPEDIKIEEFYDVEADDGGDENLFN